MYCTLWEQCKQTQYPHRSWKERTTALMWYCSPTITHLYQVRANTSDFWLSGQYGKYNSYVFFYSAPWALFPSKMLRCPWILCFDLLSLQYTDLTHQIWRFLVYISCLRYSWKIIFHRIIVLHYSRTCIGRK